MSMIGVCFELFEAGAEDQLKAMAMSEQLLPRLDLSQLDVLRQVVDEDVLFTPLQPLEPKRFPVRRGSTFESCLQSLALLARFSALPGFTENVLVHKAPLIMRLIADGGARFMWPESRKDEAHMQEADITELFGMQMAYQLTAKLPEVAAKLGAWPAVLHCLQNAFMDHEQELLPYALSLANHAMRTVLPYATVEDLVEETRKKSIFHLLSPLLLDQSGSCTSPSRSHWTGAAAA
ncbi:hypothetical protein WJX73_006044 [Symbiochloris irregularis]|uniref:Uncharacterized protein n=1 Tax=Symbiochloris irregularis TaxID=706552 RepID=A0AAW1NQ54_9CHLO